jgi:uncharacterized protein
MKQSDIYKLHQKHAHGKYGKKFLEIVWTHSLIVKEISLMIAKDLEKKYKIKTNKKLLIAGSLVHDIGCYDYFYDNYQFSKDYVLHGQKGYEILKENKYSEEMARFSLVHIGVGYKNMIPITLEEEIVSYADNFHSKKPTRFNFFDKEREKLEGFEKGKGIVFDRFREKFGIPDLSRLEKKYKNWHKKINEWIESVR